MGPNGEPSNFSYKISLKMKYDSFFIVTVTLHLKVKNLQSTGNLNWYIPGKTNNGVKI